MTDTEKVIRGLIFDVVVKQVVMRLITLAPYLAWPVINPVFVFVVTQLISLFYDEVSKVIHLAIIDHKVEDERRQYQDALDRLEREITKSKEQQDAKAIDEARKNAKKHLDDLIRMPGRPATK